MLGFAAELRAVDALQAESVQRAKAEKLADDTRRLLSRHYVGNGTRLVDDGDLTGSLVWFAEALKLDHDDPAREQMHRFRLAAFLRRCPKLTRMHLYDFDEGERFGPSSVDGRRFVTIGSNTVRVWNAETGQPVSPPLKHGNKVAHASFSTDASRKGVIKKVKKRCQGKRRDKPVWSRE